MAILAQSFDSVSSYLASFTWAPLVNLSRSRVLDSLKQIEFGQLIVRDSEGMMTICGRACSNDGFPRSELMVLKEAFWVRVLLFADMVGGLHLIYLANGPFRRCRGEHDH